MKKTSWLTTLIINRRKALNESQTEFGKRFNVSHASVSDWESGKSEASYKVLEFCFDNQPTVTIHCCHCDCYKYPMGTLS